MTADLLLVLLGLGVGFLLLAALDPPEGTVDRAAPSISVVIPARDEAGSLPNLLRSLDAQSWPRGQVIVVDDESTDDTAAIAEARGATVVRSFGHRLPEAGAFFQGGLTKRVVPPRTGGGVERLAAETRRAELAHWWSFAGLPLCVIWNHALGVALMVAYGLAVNLPPIAIQRYNRGRAERILRARRRRGATRPAG